MNSDRQFPVTTSIYLDTRKKRTSGKYPVKLRVTFKRVSRFYSTKFSLTSDDFDKVMGEKPRGAFKETRSDLVLIEKKASKIIGKMQPFSFDGFKRKLMDKNADGDVMGAFDNYAAMLRKEGRIGSAVAYECAKGSLSSHSAKGTLMFSDITVDFLKGYERWMISEGNSETTVGIYLRSLRRLVNLAIKSGDMPREAYPFGSDTDRYRIPEPRNIKKALAIEDIGKIFAYKPVEGSSEHFHRDIWIFSYLCNGINLKDICLLKYRDIDPDSIQFRRAKTHHSNRKSKPVVAFKTPELAAIIKRWGTQPVEPDRYVFTFLNPGLTPSQEQNRISQAVKLTNLYIRRVAKECDITAPISTYTARHSFATVLKRSGVNISFISEALGHSSMQTTESYLASFEMDEKRKIAANLTNFKPDQQQTLKKEETMITIEEYKRQYALREYRFFEANPDAAQWEFRIQEINHYRNQVELYEQGFPAGIAELMLSKSIPTPDAYQFAKEVLEHLSVEQAQEEMPFEKYEIVFEQIYNQTLARLGGFSKSGEASATDLLSSLASIKSGLLIGVRISDQIFEAFLGLRKDGSSWMAIFDLLRRIDDELAWSEDSFGSAAARSHNLTIWDTEVARTHTTLVEYLAKRKAVVDFEATIRLQVNLSKFNAKKLDSQRARIRDVVEKHFAWMLERDPHKNKFVLETQDYARLINYVSAYFEDDSNSLSGIEPILKANTTKGNILCAFGKAYRELLLSKTMPDQYIDLIKGIFPKFRDDKETSMRKSIGKEPECYPGSE